MLGLIDGQILGPCLVRLQVQSEVISGQKSLSPSLPHYFHEQNISQWSGGWGCGVKTVWDFISQMGCLSLQSAKLFSLAEQTTPLWVLHHTVLQSCFSPFILHILQLQVHLNNNFKQIKQATTWADSVPHPPSPELYLPTIHFCYVAYEAVSYIIQNSILSNKA